MKKLLSILLLVSLLASCAPVTGGIQPTNDKTNVTPLDASYASQTAWDGSTVDTSWYTANPSANVFYLSDGADLKGFVELVYSSAVNFEGKTVQLKNNINLGGKLWEIPASDAYFAGTLDGNGYAIGSFAINAKAGGQSLLGAIGGSASVKRLSVLDGKITLNALLDTKGAGGVISRVVTRPDQTVTLEDVYSNCTVTQSSSSKTFSAVGGIVGVVEGDGALVLSGCVFEGSINALNDQIGGMAGLVTGGLSLSILDCTNKGSIAGLEKIGGMVGLFDLYSGNATFQRCLNTGDLTIIPSSDAGQMGGMIGRYAASAGNLVITDCRNTGSLTYEGDGNVGGGCWMGGIGGYLVGVNGTINSITITDCSSTGDMIANRTSAGLVGFVQNCKKLNATNCWVNADLTFRFNCAKNPYVGGLFGMINLGGANTMSKYAATVTECSVTGKINVLDVGNGASYTGGLIAALRTTTANVTDCYMDVEFSKSNCEEDDVINVTLGYNQDNASVLNPEAVSYRHYNDVATPEDYLTPANEDRVIKKIGYQVRRNKGSDGIPGTADDTYDLRYVFGVRNLSDAEKAIGFEVTSKHLGKQVTQTQQAVYCSSIYKTINADGTTVFAADYNMEYLFTLTVAGISASQIEKREQNGYEKYYIKNTTLDLVPFTAESPESPRKTAEGLTGYGLSPSKEVVFQTKHFSGTLPKAFANAEGIMTSKGVSYTPADNLDSVNTAQMKDNDQYALQNKSDEGDWTAQGSVAFRLNESVPYHYYIDAASYQQYFGETLNDRYEAYHTWSFEVEEDGYYEFCFQIRLKGNDGDVETRYALIQIDDQSYGEQTELSYTITVRNGTLRDSQENQNSYLVGYGAELTQGKHTLTIRIPHDSEGISKAVSMHFRDVYVVKGEAQANQAKIPTPNGATLYDGNFDNTATYVLGNTNYEAFVAYTHKLEAAGYVLQQERSTSYEYLEFDSPNYKAGGDNTRENFFKTYTNQDYMIHVYFCEGTQNLRAVVSPVADYEAYAAVNQPTDYKTVTTPLFASLDMGAYSDQGFCFVYRLSDGRFILVDGGQWHDDKPTDDAYRLYDWLKAHADYDGDGNYENNKVTIAAWLITHHHSDHINIAMLFHDLFKDEVDIQTYLYNFPSYEYARSIPGSNVKVDYYTVRFPMMHKLMQNNNTLIAQTGFVYYFADCSIEILYTHNDFYPNEIKSFNNSSTVYKITLAGKTFLVAGDLEEPGQKVCNQMAGNLLDADFLQVTHHGWNGQIEFYQYIVNGEFDDTVVLWTLPRKENTSQYSKTANKFLKENVKQIHFGFENREYDLSK